MSESIYKILESQINYVNSLNNNIKSAIEAYTGNEYEDLNYKLRSNLILNPYELKLINLIDSAFEGAPPIDQPITVYRGIKSKYMPDLSSYVSTTHNIEKTSGFIGKYCCLFIILIPPGSQILPIETISSSPSEKEILLPRNGKFIITNMSTETTMDTYNVSYIPKTIIPLTPKTNLLQIIENKPLGSEIEMWVERIINLVNPEELELFGPEDLIQSIVETSFKNYKIPKEAIEKTIIRLMNTE